MRSRRTALLFVWLTVFLCPARVLCAQGSTERSIGEPNNSVLLISAIVVLQSMAIVALLVDRRRKKRAAREASASEERFAKVFRTNPQPMLLTTLKEGRCIDVNEGFLRLTGFDRHEIIGKTRLELGLFRNNAERKAIVGELLQTGSARKP